MKKIALFLALVMLVSICVTPALAEDKQLVFAWWGNQTRNERTQAVLDQYAAANEGITFDPQFVAWADYWNKLATASAGHTLPDLVQMDYLYLNQYVSNGLLVDLKPYVESGALNIGDVSEGIVASGSVDGGIYAICLGVNAPSMFYNKTLLDANGITVKDNMTIDEFVDLCKTVYEKTGYKSNIAFGSDQFLNYQLCGIGKSIFSGKTVSAEVADVAKVFSIYENGFKEGWHLGSEVFAETSVGSIEQDPLIYGSSPETMSWCAFNWSNQLTAMQTAAPEGMEIGITTWSSPDVKLSNYLKPSQFISVTVDSKYTDDAVKFVDYITNSVECNEVLLAERGIPASAAVATAIAPLLDANNQKVIDYINNVVTPNCSAVPPADPDGSTEVFALCDQIVEQLLYGAIDAQAAAEQFVSEATSIMSAK